MPAWATRIPDKNDIVMLTAYVASLRGSSPANAKGPDGSPISAWPEASASTPAPAKDLEPASTEKPESTKP